MIYKTIVNYIEKKYNLESRYYPKVGDFIYVYFPSLTLVLKFDITNPSSYKKVKYCREESVSFSDPELFSKIDKFIRELRLQT